MKILLTISKSFLVISSVALINSCTKESTGANTSATGKGGSVTRFTIAQNYLYVVSNHFLYVYSLSNPATPDLVHTSDLNYDIETIYPYNKYLFLGTRTGLYVCCGGAGLKIFNVKKPYTPILISSKTDGNYLDVIPYNGMLICDATDGIILYDITNPASPALIKKIQ